VLGARLCVWERGERNGVGRVIDCAHAQNSLQDVQLLARKRRIIAFVNCSLLTRVVLVRSETRWKLVAHGCLQARRENVKVGVRGGRGGRPHVHVRGD